jgi:adenylate cyclase
MAGDGVENSSETEAQPSSAGAPVFISYASLDAAVANSIVETLEQHGIQCWIAPRDVTPGLQYADEIVTAINNAKALVLVLSENAVASSHVGREVERAASKRRGIIVLRTDAAPLTRSFEYFLSESQWIDVTALGMPAALAKLTQAVRQRLAPESWVSPGLGRDVRNPADRKQTFSYLTTKRLIAAAVFLVFGALVVGVMVRYWPSKHGAAQAPVVAAISDKSIAVLPFVDMSEKKDQEYFADGMAEEIIDLLSRAPDLRVPARTSSFYFKGKQTPITDIARALGVEHVLEGSVRKSGKMLRVTVQLIRVDSGYHVWSQTYDRKLDDIFKIQDEIASTVVKELKTSLLQNDLRMSPTQNSEAYTLYLEAKALFRRGEPADYQSAYELLQQALVLDPQFANAWSEIAWIRVRQLRLNLVPLSQANREAHAAIEKALQLAPNLGDAHLTKGRISYVMDWNWLQAESEINRAIDLDPGMAESYQWAGMVQETLGRPTEAMRLYQQAGARDPLAPHAYNLSAQLYMKTGNWADAEKNWARAHALFPSMYDDSYVALVDLARERPEAALTSLGNKITPYRNYLRARIYIKLGRKTDADAEITGLEQSGLDNMSYYIAVLHALRGDISAAFKWLELAYDRHDLGLTFIKGNPDLRILEGDPRYMTLLKKMNLPE